MKNVQRQYFKRNNSIFLLLNKSLKFKYSIWLQKEGDAVSPKNLWKDVSAEKE